MKSLVPFLAALALHVGVEQAQAGPISISGAAGNSLTALGDTIGSNYDQLNVTPFGPASFAIPFGIPTSETLSSFDFVVGINASVPQSGYSYTLTVPFTIDGVTESVSQPFNLDISYSDTLTLETGSPTTFHLPSGATVEVTLLGQDPVTQGVGTYSGHLEAIILETPEPTSVALFGVATLTAGYFGLRRRKTIAT